MRVTMSRKFIHKCAKQKIKNVLITNVVMYSVVVSNVITCKFDDDTFVLDMYDTSLDYIYAFIFDR